MRWAFLRQLHTKNCVINLPLPFLQPIMSVSILIHPQLMFCSVYPDWLRRWLCQKLIIFVVDMQSSCFNFKCIDESNRPRLIVYYYFFCELYLKYYRHNCKNIFKIKRSNMAVIDLQFLIPL